MPGGVEPYIDLDRWPSLAPPAHARFHTRRARALGRRLSDLFEASGISASSDGDARFTVVDGQGLDRMVSEGWLGVAQAFMAGEVEAEPLPAVLAALLAQPLEDSWAEKLAGVLRPAGRDFFGPVQPGDLPVGLVELYAGATRATGAALFASSPRATETDVVTVGKEAYPLDVTWYEPPAPVDRRDLDDAQLRRIHRMLDAAGVRAGARVLELPSSGGQLAIEAARRGAAVDVLTSERQHAEAVVARARAAGVGGAVRVEVIADPVPSPRQWSGTYDAVVSVERLETTGPRGWRGFLRAVDRMLAADGVAVIQSVTATPEMTPQADEALDVMRAYIWPALGYPTAQDVRSVAEEHTGLRVVAEAHMGAHYAATLPLWRTNFQVAQRQAAAAGFDATYRRLWDYQLALHEALVATGNVECMQFTLRPR